MLDERRRHHLIDAFIASHGEETAMALADEIFSTDHATKTDLERFATKTDLEAFATKADLHALEARIEAKLSDQLVKHGAVTAAIVALATIASRIGT